jgi:hypothetical protein
MESVMALWKYLLPLLVCLAACERAAPPAAAVRGIETPAGPGASLPRLTTGPDREVWLSWVEPGPEGGHALRFSVLSDLSWGPARTVATGRDWFVNWADFPSVTPLGGGRVAAHWLVKRPGGTYAYDVAVAVSSDGGNHWGEALTPHGDATATEHGFVSLFPLGDQVGAVWLDGRDTLAAADSGASGHAAHAGGMTLRAGRIDPESGTADEVRLDRLVCDCCQTGAATTTGDGTVVVYRDRSADEVRDIAVVRQADGVWSTPAPIANDGWRIEGCPVNGPAVDARGPRVVVAWFTGAGQPRVQAALSTTGGHLFSRPVAIAAGSVLGRVDAAMLDDGSSVISWLEHAGEAGAEIRYRRIDPLGTTGPVQILATTSPARSAGFPQMTSGADGLVFAWTRVGEPSAVETVTVLVPPLTGD